MLADHVGPAILWAGVMCARWARKPMVPAITARVSVQFPLTGFRVSLQQR
jgi:hypothetical protein